MKSPAKESILDEAARQHRELIERAAETRWENVAAVLNVGSAVTLHGVLERSVIYPASKYLSAAVVQQLIADHKRLAEELGCLDELSRLASRETRPSPPEVGDDLQAMSRAMLERLRSHLVRDERVLYGPLVSLDLISATDSST